MSHPDYEQCAHDHAAILVLVRNVTPQIKYKAYNKFYERICKVSKKKTNITCLLVKYDSNLVREGVT